MHKYALKDVTLFRWVRDTLRKQSAAGKNMREHRRAFYEHAWRDVAAHEGCIFKPLEFYFAEVHRGDHSVQGSQNFSPLNDSVIAHLAGHKPISEKGSRISGRNCRIARGPG